MMPPEQKRPRRWGRALGELLVVSWTSLGPGGGEEEEEERKSSDSGAAIIKQLLGSRR